MGLVSLEVDLSLRRSVAHRGLRPAELQHRRLLVGHHREVSPGGELGHGVSVSEIPVAGAGAVALGAARLSPMLGDVVDLQRGEEVHLPLLGQDPAVLLLSVLQQGVRRQPRRLVVAQLQRGDLPPRVLHLLQPGGELAQGLPAVRGRPQTLRADHGARVVGSSGINLSYETSSINPLTGSRRRLNSLHSRNSPTAAVLHKH